MTAPPEVLELVERFRRNIDAYKRDDYKETRVDLIDAKALKRPAERKAPEPK